MNSENKGADQFSHMQKAGLYGTIAKLYDVWSQFTHGKCGHDATEKVLKVCASLTLYNLFFSVFLSTFMKKSLRNNI